MLSTTGAVAVHGPIFEHWQSLGGEDGLMGPPVGNQGVTLDNDGFGTFIRQELPFHAESLDPWLSLPFWGDSLFAMSLEGTFYRYGMNDGSLEVVTTIPRDVHTVSQTGSCAMIYSDDRDGEDPGGRIVLVELSGDSGVFGMVRMDFSGEFPKLTRGTPFAKPEIPMVRGLVPLVQTSNTAFCAEIAEVNGWEVER